MAKTAIHPTTCANLSVRMPLHEFCGDLKSIQRGSPPKVIQRDPEGDCSRIQLLDSTHPDLITSGISDTRGTDSSPSVSHRSHTSFFANVSATANGNRVLEFNACAQRGPCENGYPDLFQRHC